MRSKIRWFTDSANHTTYRISLRSSSLREPRHPLLRVVTVIQRQCVHTSALQDCFYSGL
ncbi:predicted protein [Ostreococcus lucimarinus CCE9901]|uniref:Uncharacterized protein n=1 Tax=Ostreococcus lucimarinus (strain CCE9901) TaxID=436017 RepID=A4S1P2_OSTLU|nr:predicted protein [Ostreococcus lucimarinus CCE9901]XP_001420591.1 predicted protein [Ostreococcus lucimarinus CCE9901]ABO97694.1 predicted protein [Ostreococcus lucimarinus CCE9901]ABO98884.1 predicted protein [Ostreococcus lucimarinus CCE9901]|eukprot:XP_001419401.1 predicted protein [Ostreococcus lucimarinus CCE9901]